MLDPSNYRRAAYDAETLRIDVLNRMCPICRRLVTRGMTMVHDPAHHVATAYHVASTDWPCASCGEKWPCSTRQTYGPVI